MSKYIDRAVSEYNIYANGKIIGSIRSVILERISLNSKYKIQIDITNDESILLNKLNDMINGKNEIEVVTEENTDENVEDNTNEEINKEEIRERAKPFEFIIERIPYKVDSDTQEVVRKPERYKCRSFRSNYFFDESNKNGVYSIMFLNCERLE